MKKIVQIKFEEAMKIAAKNQFVYRIDLYNNTVIAIRDYPISAMYEANKSMPSAFLYFYYAESEGSNESI